MVERWVAGGRAQRSPSRDEATIRLCARRTRTTTPHAVNLVFAQYVEKFVDHIDRNEADLQFKSV